MREGGDGRELCGGGEREVTSRFAPGLPLPEELVADLRAYGGGSKAMRSRLGVPLAASFAAASARSLPVMPEWPGVHPIWAAEPERDT